MPTTEFNLTARLLEIIDSLRAENAALTELLLQAGHLMPREEVSVVTIPSKMQPLGRMPWYQRKARLERIHKPKVSELTGIPEHSGLLDLPYTTEGLTAAEQGEVDASQVS